LFENQHVRPSPLLLSNVFKHPSGHELPIKQKGAIPCHLHKSADADGTILKHRRIRTVVVNIEETIIDLMYNDGEKINEGV
jgi:hypothetical protein